MRFEAFRLGLLAFVAQITIMRRGENVRELTFYLFCDVLDGWSRSSLAPHVASSLKFPDDALGLVVSRSSECSMLLFHNPKERIITHRSTLPFFSPTRVLLVELVSILPCQKMGCMLNRIRVSPTQEDSSRIQGDYIYRQVGHWG